MNIQIVEENGLITVQETLGPSLTVLDNPADYNLEVSLDNVSVTVEEVSPDINAPTIIDDQVVIDLVLTVNEAAHVTVVNEIMGNVDVNPEIIELTLVLNDIKHDLILEEEGAISLELGSIFVPDSPPITTLFIQITADGQNQWTLPAPIERLLSVTINGIGYTERFSKDPLDSTILIYSPLSGEYTTVNTDVIHLIYERTF